MIAKQHLSVMGSLIGGKTADRPADRTGRGGEKRIETGNG